MAREMIIPIKTVIGHMQATNVVPNKLAPKDVELLEGNNQSKQAAPDDTLSNIDLYGTSEWNIKEQVSCTITIKGAFLHFPKVI